MQGSHQGGNRAFLPASRKHICLAVSRPHMYLHRTDTDYRSASRQTELSIMSFKCFRPLLNRRLVKYIFRSSVHPCETRKKKQDSIMQTERTKHSMRLTLDPDRGFAHPFDASHQCFSQISYLPPKPTIATFCKEIVLPVHASLMHCT